MKAIKEKAMNNETDLYWLARNVHKWPSGDHQPWCYVYWKGGQRAVSANCITVIQPCARIEKADWLARRAELQNKPSWDFVCGEINFISQCEDGQWIGHEDRPVEGAVCFEGDCEVAYFGYGEVLGDWRDTLEKRPADLSEQAVTARLKDATDNVLAAVPELMTDKYKFTPFTSIEDNQEKGMKQDNGWYERGELPPVGLMCEIRHSCWNSEKYDKVTIVAITNEYLIVKYETLEQHYMLKDISFRPIRTERDVLLSIIVEEMNRYDTDGKLADAILAAGFKRDGGEK